MIRTAVLFGIWTVVCMTVAIVGFFVTADLIDGEPNMFSRDNPSWGAVTFLLSFSPVAGIVAGLLWALFHRGGRAPGWLIYVALAGLVVAISHMLVFGFIASIGSEDVLRSLAGAVFMFLVHGWLSVPVALFGTALFVLWNRRGGAAA